MALFILFACAEEPEETEVCPDMPASATPAPTILYNADDCGYWSVVVGEQLVLDISITEVEIPCELVADTGLKLLYEPAYSNMGLTDPKWTFQVLAESEAAEIDLVITCEEGTEWNARVDVIAAE